LCEGIALTEGPLQSLEEGGLGLAWGGDLPATNGLLASSETPEGRCAPPAFGSAAQEPRSGGGLGKVTNLGEESRGLHWETPQDRLKGGETKFDSSGATCGQNIAAVSTGRCADCARRHRGKRRAPRSRPAAMPRLGEFGRNRTSPRHRRGCCAWRERLGPGREGEASWSGVRGLFLAALRSLRDDRCP